MAYLYHCPYCNSSTKTVSENLHTYGCPLKTCRTCKKQYIDPYCEELALTPYRPYSVPRLFIGHIFHGIGLSFIITALVLFLTGSEPAAWITWGISFPVCWVLFFLFSLLKRKKVDQRHYKAWKSSYQRLQDPAYAALLANLGYNVPAHYLPLDFKYASAAESYKPAKVSGFDIT